MQRSASFISKMQSPSKKLDTTKIRIIHHGRIWKIVPFHRPRLHVIRQLQWRWFWTFWHFRWARRQPSLIVLLTSYPKCNLRLSKIFEQELSKDKNNIKAVITRVFSKTDDQLKLVGASDTGSTCCLAFVRK